MIIRGDRTVISIIDEALLSAKVVTLLAGPLYTNVQYIRITTETINHVFGSFVAHFWSISRRHCSLWLSKRYSVLCRNFSHYETAETFCASKCHYDRAAINLKLMCTFSAMFDLCVKTNTISLQGLSIPFSAGKRLFLSVDSHTARILSIHWLYGG